jgi:hypothetical protein
MTTMYLLTVSSVHNDDDDGGSQHDGNPVHRTTLFESSDKALAEAERVVAAECDDDDEDDHTTTEVTSGRITERQLFDAKITNWCSHTFVTVDALQVVDKSSKWRKGIRKCINGG